MQDIKDYWTDKEKRAEIAKAHTKEMEEKYSKEIKYSIENTKVCTSIDILRTEKEEPENTTVKTRFYVCDIDTVGAILEFSSEDKRIAALNFASYKNAGGMFVKGSRAQEECLCYESFLYNVLKENESYYEANRKNKNRALYHNRALYSPDVIFEREERLCYCDVITCAAPNKRAAQKYCNVSDEENSRVLESRMLSDVEFSDKAERKLQKYFISCCCEKNMAVLRVSYLLFLRVKTGIFSAFTIVLAVKF